MPYSLIDYYAGQMAAHFGRLPPRPGGFRPGGFRRPGGGFRRPFRRPFAPRRGPWAGPGPAPVYYETEPLCTDEWGTPIPCEPVAVAYPEPASTIDMSDVWSQEDEDELGAILGALEEDTDEDGMGAFRPGRALAMIPRAVAAVVTRGPRGHLEAAAKLDARSQFFESQAARLRAAGKERKAARLEKRAHRADIRSDWQTAQAEADLARAKARSELLQGSSYQFTTDVDEKDLEEAKFDRWDAWQQYLTIVRSLGNNEMNPLSMRYKRNYCNQLVKFYKLFGYKGKDLKDMEKFCMSESLVTSPTQTEEPLELLMKAVSEQTGALDDTHEVWSQTDEEDLEAMLSMGDETEQTGALDDTHEVWSQDDEEDLEAMLADGEATPMGSACGCGDVGI